MVPPLSEFHLSRCLVKLHYWMSLCALLAAGVVDVATADACIGPDTMMKLEATSPAQYEEGVGLSPTIIIQFGPQSGYPGEEGLFGGYNPNPPVLTVTDAATGDVVETTELEWLSIEESERGFITHATSLQPSTVYVAALSEEGGGYHEWQFTTGVGDDVAPFAPPTSLEITLDAYFGHDPQYHCCPEQFIGECPNCFYIGDEPLPTVNAAFDLLAHPAGAGAIVYTLLSRANVDNAQWGVRKTGSFEFDRGALAVEGRQADDDLCYQVIARSVVEPVFEVVSNVACRNGDEVFSEWPDYGPYDHSRVMCGDDDGHVPENNDTEDPEDPENNRDGNHDTDDDFPESEDGWDLAEGGAKSDSGCGCASAGEGTLPGSLLVLGLVGLLRRRR